MKFARLGPEGQERPVVLVDDQAFSITSLVDDIDAGFWTSGAPGRIAEALAAGRLPLVEDADRLRIGAPLARPGALVCVGLNYAAHAAESGVQPPAAPVIFLKVPNTVVGPDDAVTIPRNSTKTDWEVELGVVIGSRASYLATPEEALGHVGGYFIANDVSEREFQLELSGGQWSKGKVSPGFSPLGPWLVTADEIDPSRLGLRSFVNGEPRQDSSTADMIFDVAYIVHHLSQFMTLDPGDVVLTGTPEGVALSGRFPYLAPGDVVELEIDGLGRQRQEFVGFGGVR
ncbi:fumarylacetoacetate hydrolase family protein [Microbacterium sp. 4R-513]|uniref:fumarylacetoacetate hydrolase family protein n=1 Tax=Microbacterium sp. 4R-513 TaxID=2567934 RepID=UPI0013E10451|nr:fumarylacetoacetate hydrolase family protein [Microbacterium sp. 4R-513]QIG39545.1 fumarylacetoacetate hydrolase family protein [Microbacterium sp. 4R-513]